MPNAEKTDRTLQGDAPRVDATHQTADVAIRFGALSLRANVAVTSGGLLAIAALVGAILVSTALLVREAKR